MKEKIMNNIVLKLGAIAAAIFVWIVVVNTDNPMWNSTRSGIPIEFVNTDVFTNNHKTFRVVDGVENVSIIVRARRLNLSSIRNSDFHAVVDCNKITDFNGAVKVEVTYTGDPDLLSSFEVVNDIIQIETEDIEHGQRTVQVDIVGEPASGYTVGNVTLHPNQVTLTAPTSKMALIDHVGATVDVSGADADISREVELVFYDALGNAILLTEEDQVTISSEKTTVTVPILKTSQVALDYSTVVGIQNVAAGYRYTGVECDVKTIPVEGLKSVVSNLNKIVIPPTELDVTGADGDLVKEIDVAPFLPNNVSVVGSSIVTVTLKVEKLVDRTFDIAKRKLEVIGLNEKLYTYEYLTQTPFYSVVVRGLEDDLKLLAKEQIDVVLSVEGLEEGVHEVIPQISFEDGYEWIEPTPIEVTVRSIEPPTTEETTQESSSEATSGAAR